MPSYILGFTIAFTIAVIVIPLIIQLANNRSLFDKPNDRKVHKFPTPTLGGIAIFIGFFVATTLTLNLQELSEVKFIMYAAAFMVLTGIIDDILSISFIKKALTQLISALLIVYWDGIRITNVYGLFGFNELGYVASLIITMLVMFTIINAINFIDGIDGNASLISSFILGFLGIWFHLTGNYTYSLIAFVTIGSILAFLRYNVSPAKIFMGDTGSLFIGLIISVLSLKFIQLNQYAEGAYYIPSAPSFLFGFMIVPVFDLFRLVVVRLFNGRSPFNADQNHIHHNLLILGLNHNQSSILLLFISIMFGMISIVFKDYNSNVLLSVHGLVSLMLLSLMAYKLKKREAFLLKIFNFNSSKFSSRKTINKEAEFKNNN